MQQTPTATAPADYSPNLSFHWSALCARRTRRQGTHDREEIEQLASRQNQATFTVTFRVPRTFTERKGNGREHDKSVQQERATRACNKSVQQERAFVVKHLGCQ
jgi:hypothetical protein